MKTDNELIAEFMGATKQVITDRKEYGYPEGKIIWHNLFDEGGYVTHLEFDTSWDWLMPVVEKIHKPEIIKGRMVRADANVTIYYKVCLIEYSGDEESGCNHGYFKTQQRGETKIEAVYKAVVEFIKFLNTQKD